MTKSRVLVLSFVSLSALTLVGVDQYLRRLPVASPGESEGVVPPPKPEVASESQSATDILQLAMNACREIEDYQCTVTSLNRLGTRVERNVINVSFKQPGLFRHAIIDGSSRGVLITYNRDKVVKARPGGILSMMTVQMDPRDQRLVDGRGKPFFQTDWSSELKQIQEHHDAGALLVRLTDRELGEATCWVVQLTLPGPHEETNDLWVDQTTHLPRRMVSMRRGQTLRDASYSNIALNMHPADDFFNLK